MAQTIDTLVFPSFEALKKLEAERKISGGVCVGERRIVFIAEAANNADLDRLIKSLPIWAITTTQAVPLVTFEERYAAERDYVAQMKRSAR
jgi:hypothetical protein